jgi:hypothetical protein
MADPSRVEDRPRPFRLLGRVAAIALSWLLTAGIGTACFFPPWATFPLGASDDWAPLDNALVFASSAAIVGAVAAVVALAVAGERKRALEVALAVSLAIALLAAVACTCLWLAPGIARGRMGFWEFERLRGTLLRWCSEIVRYQVPLGAVVGPLSGALAGLWAVLARHRPRLATGLALGLLFACAAGPVQQFAFGLVVSWGYFVRWRIWSPGMTDPFVPASGVSLGAIAGAILAAGATAAPQHWRREHRSGRGRSPGRPDGDGGPRPVH